MKSKKEKQTSFLKEMKRLKREGQLKEEKQSFIEVLKKAIKPQASSH